MTTLLSRAEENRLLIASTTDRKHKSALGQFMTPASTANFMAGLFAYRDGPARLLDPGAGLGALTCAVLDRWIRGELCSGPISVTAYELDDRLRPYLAETLASYTNEGLTSAVERVDYLQVASAAIQQQRPGYTHAILNPPYKKISTHSDARRWAEAAGLVTVNLYSAFVGLALAQLEMGGQLVAIIPRSFCNGPYYKPFRQWILDRAAIRHIHVFETRTQAFKDDAVLQENVILLLERGGAQGPVRITTSSNDAFEDVLEHEAPFSSVVRPNDADLFFHVGHEEPSELEASPYVNTSLADLGVTVSTGPVVTFRLREHLLSMPAPGTAPMLYPGHGSRLGTTWPLEGFRKANAIAVNGETKRWLFPGGTYVLVRRMSSMEEARRVVASLLTPADVNEAPWVGLDNGLNVFHTGKATLDPTLALGLLVYLNSTALDEHFRRFNGHTQVNATDLRNMPYPSKQLLMEMGEWARTSDLSQVSIDRCMGRVLSSGSTGPSQGSSMSQVEHIQEAIEILQELDFPRQQLNERTALCLLALLDLKPDDDWRKASSPMMGITPIMDWARDNYGKTYAPNTRETFRRQSMHQFVAAGLALYNPDKPDRAVNSPAAVYQIEPTALGLMRQHGTRAWVQALEHYKSEREGLAKRYQKVRSMSMIPVTLSNGQEIQLTAGEHSQLIADVIGEFAPRFAPGGELIYAGDTGQKTAIFDRDRLKELGVEVNDHGKMPDLVIYDRKRDWLLLVEAVTSHGPVDGKRHAELCELFAKARPGLVFVTSFPSRKLMGKYLSEIAWETEVWVSEAPDHLIHFNGDRYLGPHPTKDAT